MKRLTLLLLLALTVFAPVQAQAPGLVSMNASVGFAGRFRDNLWTPVQVSLENNSTRSFSGELVVRPERSRGVTNPVSTPVSLAPDSQQQFTLYISLRSFAESVRVELLTDDGIITTELEASVTHVLPRERLVVRVSDGTGRPVDLSEVASYGQRAVETDWFINSLPDRGVGLEAADAIVFANADTGQLTPQQRTAIRDWVLGGGHLTVIGGSNWEETAAGIEEILPFIPESSALSADFGDLRRLSGSASEPDATETVIARGELAEGASALALDSEGRPLVARHAMGNGLVDYLAFDPTSAPFVDWDGTQGLWFSLATSRDVRPGWSFGFLNLTQGYNAVEILPGVTALPEAMAMIGFLFVYVVLIGPVNYLVLSRIGRREFAWFTIPAMIVVFTLIAWATGFNLRGTEVVISRLSVVESWPDTGVSHVRQLIGLLSPRRANYDLTLPDTRALRPLLRTAQGGFFGNQASTVEILQSDVFNAVDFPIDASYMAGFVTDGMTATETPISGSVSIIEDAARDTQLWRGSIRNDLPVALTDVVLLSRSGVMRLDTPLAAGEIRILEETVLLPAYRPIPAAPIEYATNFLSPSQSRYVSRGRDDIVSAEQSLIDIVGEENFRSALFYGLPMMQSTALEQGDQRKQTFLSNFIIDQYNSTARGDNVYLIGWTEQAPLDEEVSAANTRSVDTTVYITRLDVSVQSSSGAARDRVTPDQFMWTLIDDEAVSNSTPNFISAQNSTKLAFRLTPVPASVLETVDELVLLIERGSSSLNNTQIRMMNWQTGEYELLTLDGDRTVVRDFEDYIGPNNAVQIEIDRLQAAGALAVTSIAVEQYGTRRG